MLLLVTMDGKQIHQEQKRVLLGEEGQVGREGVSSKNHKADTLRSVKLRWYRLILLPVLF